MLQIRHPQLQLSTQGLVQTLTWPPTSSVTLEDLLNLSLSFPFLKGGDNNSYLTRLLREFSERKVDGRHLARKVLHTRSFLLLLLAVTSSVSILSSPSSAPPSVKWE